MPDSLDFSQSFKRLKLRFVILQINALQSPRRAHWHSGGLKHEVLGGDHGLWSRVLQVSVSGFLRPQDDIAGLLFDCLPLVDNEAFQGLSG
jgi:hypothetical protein